MLTFEEVLNFLKQLDFSEAEEVKKANEGALIVTCSHIEYVSQFLDQPLKRFNYCFPHSLIL